MAAPRNTLTSKIFWSLMDRWEILDAEALLLLAHPGGLTEKGTRQRFALTPDEAHRLTNLLAADRLLTDIFGEPAPWLRRPNRANPFKTTKPINFMIRHGAEGIDRTRHFLAAEALRRSQ
jgi:hypothetical protein